MTDSERDKRMKSVAAKIEIHSRDLDRMEAELADLERRAAMIESFTNRAQDMASRLDELTDAEKGEIMKDMV